WDLIEESPAFSDEERLKVTNAFSRQLEVRAKEGLYKLTEPLAYVGDRHAEWAAISLYCLGRYFQTYYPDPIWEHAVKAGAMHFAPLSRSSWIGYANDHLWWYNTMTSPILTYMLLSGDRTPLRSGALQERLLGQEMLISGALPDWALDYGAASYFSKAAYLTGDGRWLEYRNRIGLDLDCFRLGQSYWPDEGIKPRLPEDLVGKWSVYHLPGPMWEWRQSGLPAEDSFMFGSFRSAADGSGDYILLDGFNGGGRNPYHTFPILELRLAGHTILKGYRNQVMTRADGMTGPTIAMDAALRRTDVIGRTAVAIGEVPNAAHCNWRRTIAQRVGRYTVVVDDLTPTTSTDNLQIETLWETPNAAWDDQQQALRVKSSAVLSVPEGWHRVRARDATCTGEPTGDEIACSPLTLDGVLLRAYEAGPALEMRFTLPEALSGQVFADIYRYVNCGRASLSLDGERLVDEFDGFAMTPGPMRLPLGERTLAAGQHLLRAEVLGKHEGQEKCFVALMGLSVRPEGASADDPDEVFEIRPSDPATASRSGYVTTLERYEAAQQGEPLVAFSLLGPAPDDRPLACVRVAANAAALALPEPALAVAGKHAVAQADLAVVAGDYLLGLGLIRAGVGDDLISAEAPVDVDWDLRTGELAIAAGAATSISLRLAGTASPRVVEGTGTLAGQGAAIKLTAPAGRHSLEGAVPDGAALAKLSDQLAQVLAEGLQRRAAEL
ncbi:MAG TPA: hypothetical protein VM283_02630, partial [Armatimonadota bacterium]|nr:hypothetical protein [Armatimonadota bacterium]